MGRGSGAARVVAQGNGVRGGAMGRTRDGVCVGRTQVACGGVGGVAALAVARGHRDEWTLRRGTTGGTGCPARCCCPQRGFI
eukprot:scaffold28175_cov122-Isochrysis_galbana.AAC.1